METTREELIWEEAEAGVTLSGGKPDKRLEEISENSQHNWPKMCGSTDCCLETVRRPNT